MPTHSKMESFIERLHSALASSLGPDWRLKSNAEIIRQTSLPISEETLRKIRIEGYAPSLRIQSLILKRLQTPVLATAMQFVDSGRTRDEVRALLGAGVHEVVCRPGDPRLDCDLVLEDRSLGLRTYIVRCLDDAVGESAVGPLYFMNLIANLEQVMAHFEALQGVIITHRRAPQEAESLAKRFSINIRSYDDFAEARLGKVKLKETIDRMRSDRQLDDHSFTSLPAQLISRNSPQNVDSIEALKKHFGDAPGAATAAILGSFGSGKTSTLLTLAHFLTHEERGPDWALPLWIDAASLSHNIDETLQAAAARLSPETPLPVASIKKLVGRGRLWIFIDALDEALALRNPEDLRLLIDKYVSTIQPSGRLIFSARQEMFDSVDQELDLFDTTAHEGVVFRSLILRMGRMPSSAVKSSIRARLPAEAANKIISRIDSDPVLSELVTRPIFMHIATLATTGALAEASGSGIAALFEAYVQTWSFREANFNPQSRMPMADRLATCELLALNHMILGQSPKGFSVADLSNFARSQLTDGLEVKNIDLFVYEARIAMFLERRGDDHFEFAHQSMREFFLARRAAREITDAANSLMSPQEASFAPYKCRTLGRVPFRRQMVLARKFTIELCASTRLAAQNTISSLLQNAKNWQGHGAPDILRQETFIESPPFGPGRYRYLLPNLVGLLQMLEDRQGAVSIDLAGADLSLVDLSDALSPERTCKVSLRDANLWGVRLPRGNSALSISIADEGALIDARAADYCIKHGLMAQSRFNRNISNEFVLVEGGEYTVISSEGKQINVKVGPYLIQRFPVTNRQFKSFLDRYPEWGPDEVRRSTQNDYYLGYWPLDCRSDSLLNDEWLDRPVVQINWRAAAAFAAAAGMRLPTEVEWEIAARLGAKSPEMPRPWGKELTYDRLVCAVAPTVQERLDPGLQRRVPTISVLNEEKNVPGFVNWKNSLKIDVPSYMIGLVREWVMDVWRPGFPYCDPTSQLDAPVNLVTQIESGGGAAMAGGVLTPPRVLRGGGFNSTDEHLTAHFRAPHRVLNVNPDVGFRCVRPVMLRGASPHSH